MLKRFSYVLGNTVRETAYALDRVGCRLQGNYAFTEELSRHRRVMGLYDKQPAISQDVFIAPNASVIGSVSLGEGANVWYGSVLRGDVNDISVGKKSSIGNRSVVHASGGLTTLAPTKIGDNVVVGDGVVLHGCTLEDECRVDDGAVLNDNVVVEKHAIVGPGAVVTSGKRVPSGQVWAGNPAKYVRDVSEEEKEFAGWAEKRYTQAKAHLAQTIKLAEEKEVDLLTEDILREMRPGTRFAD